MVPLETKVPPSPTHPQAGVGENRGWSMNISAGVEALENTSKFKNVQDAGSHIALEVKIQTILRGKQFDNISRALNVLISLVTLTSLLNIYS